MRDFLKDRLELEARLWNLKILKKKIDRWVLENLITCKYCEYFEEGECYILPSVEHRHGHDKKCKLFVPDRKHIPSTEEFEKTEEEKT